MEAVENALVEGKILWLAQTILEGIFSGKHDEWIRHVGLGEGTEQLKSEIERVETVVAAAKGRATGNKPLARSLARLSELMYDADDLLDELDYFRLQEQVEKGTIACATESERTDGDEAEQVEGSRDNPHIRTSKRRKNRCEGWNHFAKIIVDGKTKGAICNYCRKEVACGGNTGTKGLMKHIRSKHPAAEQPQNHTRKRMRADEASTSNMAATAHPWNNAGISKRMHQIASQLQSCREDVRKFVKDSVASTVHQRNTSATRLRTSSLLPRKVFGRDEEKDNIISKIKAAESDVITVLPVVGVAGAGKTAVAQLVYNDTYVENQFERIWIWVSENFDKVMLTGEMLGSLSQESNKGSPQKMDRRAGISGYEKLQRMLKRYMESLSKKFLLVLDDVWDSMDDSIWNELLSPLQSSHVKGNVILVTARNLSVARRIGTVEPIKLGALGKEDVWLLCKAFAFGSENYEQHSTLNIIGKQIAAKLKGNPLAAETAGELLKQHLTVNHWSSVLKGEDWKSLQLNRGIMTALKLSYDHLPYHLQQCFLYCSMFPDNYQFLAEDVVRIWISQGFVRCTNSRKTLEETGQEYFLDLANLGVFEEIERYHTPGDQTSHVMCGVMHDFARIISKAECEAFDGTECKEMEMLPTIRHLSILTDSAYCNKDQRGSLLRNLQFEKKIRGVFTSTRKLRTLVLIGKYDSFFFQSFQDVLKKAPYLRMLQISVTYADSSAALCKLEKATRLRYLKLENKLSVEDFPIPLGRFYLLQVLDAGCPILPRGMDGLVSMRYLVLKTATRVTDQNNSDLEMLQSMNELVHLGVYQLENVNRAEADGAKLRDKQHMEKLHLSWKDTLSHDDASEAWSESDDESLPAFNSDTSSEPSSTCMKSVEGSSPLLIPQGERPPVDDSDPFFEAPTIYMETGGGSPVNYSNCNQVSEHFTDIARDVLEAFEPQHNLKHLQISGYSGATSPSWLGTSVTCLQTLHLEECGELKILSLGCLPFLTKLELRNMQSLIEVSIPPLEELVLIKMPKLKTCSCDSVGDLNSRSTVLRIKRCRVLEAFLLFESCEKLKIEHKSWLPRLKKLAIHKCPRLKVSNPLPPSSNACELDIVEVSTLPTMKGSTNGVIRIGDTNGEWEEAVDVYSNNLTGLDENFLSFHNLRSLTCLEIACCQNLLYISFKGFMQLISLKRLIIKFCEDLFSSDVLQASEDLADANFNALPSLKHLFIDSCGITGKWLSVMLRHAPALEELFLNRCDQISGLLIEGGQSSSSNHTSTPRASSAGNPDGTLISSTPEELLRIPSDSVSSLKKMFIERCKELTFQGGNEGFSGFASLEELTIGSCPKLIPTLVQKYESNDQRDGRWLLPCSLVKLEIDDSPETLQPCFLEDHNCLKNLMINGSLSLEFLLLRSCTALEELTIDDCDSLTVLEGDFTFLKELVLWDNSWLESLQLRSCTALESLVIGHCASLATLEGNFTCPQKLYLSDNLRLKSLQLRVCTSLEDLRIRRCESLHTLEGFRSLTGLKNLEVFGCPGLTPYLEHLFSQGNELCARLEGLHTDHYSFLTTSFCQCLTSLQRLELRECRGGLTGLTDEQERALQHLASLQELRFEFCSNLADLPVGLHSLPSLKRLGIIDCLSISRLPEKGLPPSLEELVIEFCSEELTDECRTLATTRSKPRVKIDGKYVN